MNRKRTAAVLFVALIVLPASAGLGLALSSGNAPYYDGASGNVDTDPWMDNRSNATINNTVHFLSRVGTFVVGTNAGVLGSLMTGLLVFGGVVSVSSSGRIGVVGGAVAGISTFFALEASGLAPQWIYAIALGAAGVVAAVVIMRLR